MCLIHLIYDKSRPLYIATSTSTKEEEEEEGRGGNVRDDITIIYEDGHTYNI